jgi:LacI family transcriptional regulator, gluconate utilization system Gnt-I transcriptional repressor
LRKRVELAVKSLAYVPNIAASRLASSRSHAIGVIVPTLYNVIFAEYLLSLHELLVGSGFQVIVVNSRYSAEEEENAIRTLLGQRVEAIIIVGTHHTPMGRRMLQQARVPVIETFELTDDPIDINIGLSQHQAGADTTRFLLNAGHRRISFVAGHLDLRAAARFEGYRSAMEAAGLARNEQSFTMPRQSSVALGSTIMAEILQTGPLPDALVCIDDNVALGALLECRRRGINVPGDISIMGFHDLEFAACSSPSLSSVATHRYQMGKLAAEAVISIIADSTDLAARRIRQIDVGYHILARESTGTKPPLP